MNQDTAGGRTALTGSSEGPPQGAFQGQIQIGVVHDDLGVFSAQFQGTFLVQTSRHLPHFGTHGRRARKGNQAHVRVGDQPLADLRAVAENDVHDPRGNAGLLEGLNEMPGRIRRVGRGFEDNGIAAEKGRVYFPGGDRHRKIPGRYQGADAHRLSKRHGEFVRKFRGGRLSEKTTALSRVIKGGVDGFLDVAPGFRQHLPHFAGHGPGEFLLSLLQKAHGFKQNIATPGDGHFAPGPVGLLGGGHGVVHVGRRSGRINVQAPPRGGIKILEGAPAGPGATPHAADQKGFFRRHEVFFGKGHGLSWEWNRNQRGGREAETPAGLDRERNVMAGL